MHDVRLHDVGANMIAIRLEDEDLYEALSMLMRGLGALEVSSAVLLLYCRVSNRQVGDRQVLNVDGKSQCILISAELYDE